MTALQKAIIGTAFVIAVGVGIFEARQAAQLRQQIQTLQKQQADQIHKLQYERDDVMKRFALLSARPVSRVPSRPMSIAFAANTSEADLPFTNPYVRFRDNEPTLTASQVQAFLKANRTNAASLLAAYRTSHNKALLRDAMEKYPNNLQVEFKAVFDPDLSPEEHNQWLNKFEKSAPDNALANYLSAYNDFNSGQIQQGIQELTVASGKGVTDYAMERSLDNQEAYLSAGYSAEEAATLSESSLTLPYLSQIKHLGVDLIDLANAYTQAGDPASAQATYQMAMELGQRYEDPSTDWTLISQLVGISIQKKALGAMDPNNSSIGNGLTVQEQLDQLNQQRTAIRELAQRAMPLLPTLSNQDILNFENRRRAFGELAAMQWVVGKFGQP